MSNPVKVSVKCKHKVTVCNKDEIKVSLGKDPIFSDQRAEEIVGNTMQEFNFERDPEVKTEFIKTEENTVIIWDTAENTISIKADVKKEITVEGKKTKTGDSWFSGEKEKKFKENLEKKAKNQLTAELKQKAEAQKAEVADEQKDELMSILEAQLTDALDESREIVSEIYKNWVKSRAKSLGNVTSEKITTSEDGSVFEMTIEISDNS